MRYVFAEANTTDTDLNIKRTKKILAALRQEYHGVFQLDNTSIMMADQGEEMRSRCRAFCLGYSIAKGWRK